MKNELNQQTTEKTTTRKQSPAQNADNQHRALPEVSVNPQIQSSVQQNTDQKPYLYEPYSNGILNFKLNSLFFKF